MGGALPVPTTFGRARSARHCIGVTRAQVRRVARAAMGGKSWIFHEASRHELIR
jgi:hypothetical protein